MTENAIMAKLRMLLDKGITSEAEASYLMSEVRKLLEYQQAQGQYEYLKFHCDWALHPTLAGATTQKILGQFDAASIHLKTGMQLHDLPRPLGIEVERISMMRYFRDEFEKFLTANRLPSLETSRSDGWIHFVHLYGKIVEDCPLVMTAKNTSATIANVMLKLEVMTEPPEQLKEIKGEVWFKVRWIIQNKNGNSGEIFILNSFSENPKGRHQN